MSEQTPPPPPRLEPEGLSAFLFEACAGDAEIVEQLVAIFLRSAQDLLAEMRTGLEQADFVSVRRAAHSLKSSSRIFGAEQISGQCQQIELQAKAEQAAGLGEQIAGLSAACARLEETLLDACLAHLAAAHPADLNA